MEARGRGDYPGATRLLITADAGGSNSYRYRLWKAELADFAAETGLAITVCHFPPGTSKWNKIEHRLFSHITMNWRGRPLTSHEVVVNIIAATRTRTGLRVEAALDTSAYPLGVSVSTERMRALPIAPHAERGTWNYTIRPPNRTRRRAAGTRRSAARPRHATCDLADPRLTGMSRERAGRAGRRPGPGAGRPRRATLLRTARRPPPQGQGQARPAPAHRRRQGPDHHRLPAADLLPARPVRDARGQASPIGEAITETRKLLAERRHRSHPPSCVSPAPPRCGTSWRPAPSRAGNRLATLADPALTGMSRPAWRTDRAARHAASRPGPATQPPPARRRPADRNPRRHLLREDHRRRTRPGDILGLRKICSRDVVAELFDVSRRTIGNAGTWVRPLLDHEQCTISRSATRYSSAAAVLVEGRC